MLCIRDEIVGQTRTVNQGFKRFIIEPSVSPDIRRQTSVISPTAVYKSLNISKWDAVLGNFLVPNQNIISEVFVIDIEGIPGCSRPESGCLTTMCCSLGDGETRDYVIVSFDCCLDPGEGGAAV